MSVYKRMKLAKERAEYARQRGLAADAEVKRLKAQLELSQSVACAFAWELAADRYQWCGSDVLLDRKYDLEWAPSVMP